MEFRIKFVILFYISLFLTLSAVSQNTYIEKRFYNNKGRDTTILINIEKNFLYLDERNKPVYNYYKKYKKTTWYSICANRSGYTWDCYVTPCNWKYTSRYAIWWYFEWEFYMKKIE